MRKPILGPSGPLHRLSWTDPGAVGRAAWGCTSELFHDGPNDVNPCAGPWMVERYPGEIGQDGDCAGPPPGMHQWATPSPDD